MSHPGTLTQPLRHREGRPCSAVAAPPALLGMRGRRLPAPRAVIIPAAPLSRITARLPAPR